MPHDGLQPLPRRTDPLTRLLLENVVTESVREIDGPHLVICRDPHTGLMSFQGPFPDGLSALVAADQEDESLQVSVAPLVPAL